VFHAQIAEQKNLDTTERGAKGFGSTGQRLIDKTR
jgi:dUTPase